MRGHGVHRLLPPFQVAGTFEDRARFAEVARPTNDDHLLTA